MRVHKRHSTGKQAPVYATSNQVTFGMHKRRSACKRLASARKKLLAGKIFDDDLRDAYTVNIKAIRAMANC